MMNISKFLPSKTLVAFLVVLLCFVAIMFFIFSEDEDKVTILNTGASGTTDKKIVIKDTDEDGLKDWEESLWKTDAENPDTDGDGTTDGEEVSQNRNPLVAGPDDEIVSGSIAVGGERQYAPTVNGRTQTDSLAQTLFSKYLSLKKINASLDEEEKEQLMLSLLEGVSLESADAYYFHDIVIGPKDDNESIKAYVNETGSLFLKYKDDIVMLLPTLQSVAQNKSETEMEELRRVIKNHKNLLNDLTRVAVPDSVSNIHLSMLNSLSAVVSTTNDMERVLEDPIVALLTLGPYQSSITQLSKALENLGAYLESRNIVFGEEETGFAFISLL